MIKVLTKPAPVARHDAGQSAEANGFDEQDRNDDWMK
jgi:hypothetical protein